MEIGEILNEVLITQSIALSDECVLLLRELHMCLTHMFLEWESRHLRISDRVLSRPRIAINIPLVKFYTVADLGGVRGVQLHPPLAASNVFSRAYISLLLESISTATTVNNQVHTHVSLPDSLLISQRLTRFQNTVSLWHDSARSMHTRNMHFNFLYA